MPLPYHQPEPGEPEGEDHERGRLRYRARLGLGDRVEIARPENVVIGKGAERQVLVVVKILPGRRFAIHDVVKVFLMVQADDVANLMERGGEEVDGIFGNILPLFACVPIDLVLL